MAAPTGLPIMDPSVDLPTAPAPALSTYRPTSPEFERMKPCVDLMDTLPRPAPRQTLSSSVRLSLPMGHPAAQTGPARVLPRREEFLIGHEGSRQRRRWENDRLLNNPYAQPPLPSDYLVPSTHPVRTVPYYLAPLWDAAEFQRAVESKLHGRKNSKTVFRKRREGGYMSYGGMSPMEIAAVNVPKEIKSKLKWRRGGWARGLLKDLEQDVRGFVGGWNEREMGRQEEEELDAEEKRFSKQSAAMSDTETEDEEIVFVGRNGSTSSLPYRTKSQVSLRGQAQSQQQDPTATANEQEKERQETISDSKLIYEGLEDDKSASFARWLVHCVGAYYGLRTWSETREVQVEVEGKKGTEKTTEVRREAYVGVDRRARGFVGRGERFESGRDVELPRPLWGMV